MWSPKEVTPYCNLEGQTDYPIIFGQLTKRDGSFLIGRTPQPDFRWTDLRGKHTIAGRAGGVPAMTLEYVMNKNGMYDGVDGTRINTSIAFENIVHEFTNNPTVYDYCTMFEPTASEYVAEGKGYIIASVGAESGEVPFTAFSASKSYLDKNREQATKFLRAVYKGYKYMMTTPLDTVANNLVFAFPSVSQQMLVKSLESYLTIDAWVTTPVMTRASFENLLRIIDNAGELSGTVDFDRIVDNSIALDVIA